MRTTKQTAETLTETDVATYQFATSSEAWAFHKKCCAVKVWAGYPSLDGLNIVQVMIKTWQCRETADGFASGAPCVAYRFAA